jgi:hypothetical protein
MKTEDNPARSTVGREITSGWTHDPDLVNINEMRIPPSEISGVSEGDIEKVWHTLMLHLCRRHRENKRNGRPTDYRIENLRNDHYEAFDANYFRRLIVWVAKQHPEVEVDRDNIRLSRFGFDNCKKYDRTFQRDVNTNRARFLHSFQVLRPRWFICLSICRFLFL